MKDKEKTVVVFRVWKGIGTVIALFPGIEEGVIAVPTSTWDSTAGPITAA